MYHQHVDEIMLISLKNSVSESVAGVLYIVMKRYSREEASVVQWQHAGLLANRSSDRSCSRGMIHIKIHLFAQVVSGPV